MADVWVPQDQATLPIAASDEDTISLWAYPEAFQVSGGEYTTYEWQSFAATPMGIDELQGAFEQMRARLISEQGQVVLGYAIFRRGVTNFPMPAQWCIDGNPIGLPLSQCFDVPAQICIPFTNICIQLANQTVASGYLYRFWFITAPAASGMATRPLVQLGAVAVLIIAVAVLIGLGILFGGISLLTGKITYEQYVSGVKSILRTPGENLSAPITAASLPFIALGVTIVGMGVVIPIAVAKAGAPPSQFTGGVTVKQPTFGGGAVEVSGGVGRGR